MANEALKQQIKQLVIESLQLSSIKPEDIDEAAPLFGNPRLGLDSVDALELVVALQQRFKVRINDQNLARVVLQSVESIADFVSAQGTPPAPATASGSVQREAPPET